VACQA
jgi:CRP/FNR family transcriptional regulator, cyclic AMP receptor protein